MSGEDPRQNSCPTIDSRRWSGIIIAGKDSHDRQILTLKVLFYCSHRN
jgi:hypothetical protein